jgi:hypothetical protein
LLSKAHPTFLDGQISTGHGEKEKRLFHAMRYAVQLLITIPDSKGKSVQYFSNAQARVFKLNNQA